MKIGITGDSNWESKVDKILDELDNNGFVEYFTSKNYGNNGLSIIIGLICHDSRKGLKQRIRHYKAENELVYDVMLDLETMKKSTDIERKKIVAEKL